jgi:SynChlorMet cassette radical SAM/SPASM protein ScmF
MTIEKFELPAGVPPLNSFYFYLTSGCNLACKHCWISPTFQPQGTTGGHLDYQLFELAIEEGLPLGLSHVKLTGGEPLLHPDFVRMVDFLYQKSLGLTIETNGTLLTHDLARFLWNRSRSGFISVSLDGSGAVTHDRFRGVSGSFEKACEAVAYLAEVGFKPQVIMTIHSENVTEIESLVRLAEKLGAGSVKIGIAHSVGRGSIMADRGKLLELRNLIELGKWIENYLQESVTIPVYYSWPMAFYNLKNLRTTTAGTCNILGILGVLSTGHLSMCGIGEQEPELCYGLLGQDRIADIWLSHPMLRNLRNNMPQGLEGICGDCLFRDRCLGNCVAQCFHDSKSLTTPYWFCQMADEAELFPETRRKINVKMPKLSMKI